MEVRPQRAGTELQVTPESFAPEELCTCVEGFAGSGTRCTECVNGSMSVGENRRCCGCPDGTARVDLEHGLPTNTSKSSACLRCYGVGCNRNQSTCENNSCAEGYSGVLCASCVQGYEQKSNGSLKECHACKEHGDWWPWVVVSGYGVALVGAFSFLIFMQKPERDTEADDRKVELLEQAFFLLTVVQILKTAHSTMVAQIESPVQLKLGDVLQGISVECLLGFKDGRMLEAFSTAFFLPLLCVVALLVGSCLGSPFWGLKFCIFLTSALYVGTIQASVSNFLCVSHDEFDAPLWKGAYLKEFPWMLCEESPMMQVSLYGALVLNGAVLPGSLLVLALFVKKLTSRIHDLFRNAQPVCTCEVLDEKVVLKTQSALREEDAEPLS